MKPYRTKLLNKELELNQITPDSRRQAACVLEVLAGVRTPDQAAEALSISLPTYYNLEIRALRGLIFSCTPEPPGRTLSLARKLRTAELKAAAMEKQVQRYQALLRNSQRNIGLLPPPTPSKQLGKGKRKPRKPVVRAFRAIEALQQADGPSSAPAEASTSQAMPTDAVAASG
jgi:hypothetical protein